MAKARLEWGKGALDPSVPHLRNRFCRDRHSLGISDSAVGKMALMGLPDAGLPQTLIC